MTEDFMIEQEVLEGFVNGVYAQYIREIISRDSPPSSSLRKMASEVYALSGVMYAETMEELEIINKKLFEYWIKLGKIKSGEIPVD
jgi:hypothetical protein